MINFTYTHTNTHRNLLMRKNKINIFFADLCIKLQVALKFERNANIVLCWSVIPPPINQ